MTEAIKVTNLSLSFHRGKRVFQALQGVSFSVEEGKTVGIVGPSGCGKSSLLRILSGVYTRYQGEVLIKGETPNPRKHSFALVPQHYALLPWKQVKENILLPLFFGKHPSRKNTFDEVVNTLGLERILTQYPEELSGGQQQRVALARAFLQEPDLLLLDEPFSALDLYNATRCKEFLQQRLQDDSSPTTLLVSHNLEEVADLCDEVILMQGSPGKVQKVLARTSVCELKEQIIGKPFSE